MDQTNKYHQAFDAHKKYDDKIGSFQEIKHRKIIKEQEN
jgi:hypothetical protein